MLATLASIFFIALLTLLGFLLHVWVLWQQQRSAWARRVMRVVVTAKSVHGQYAKVVLKHPQGRRLAFFRARDALALFLATSSLKRRYSLASWSSRPYQYELLIKREPKGKMSTWVHEALSVGMVLKIEVPRGDFHLTGTYGVRVLVGAGVGITPMRAMLHEIYHRPFASRWQETVLFWTVREERDLYFYHAEFLALAARVPTFTYCPIVTQPSKQWRGLTQRLSVHQILRMVPSRRLAGIWICAAPVMADALKQQAQALGIPIKKVHSEAFGGGIAPAAPAQVVLKPDSTVFPYDGQPTLLHCLEAHGISLPSDCRAGHCGLCRLRVLSGEIKTVLTPAVKLQPSEILACCSQPRGNLTLARI